MSRLPHIGRRAKSNLVGLLVFVLLFAPAGCFTKENYSPYYGLVAVRPTQDFRWFDGGLPQTFDPAFAAAPPDTDAVRAIFEGLTDYDPRTLAPVPGVATRWEPSEGGRTWTFYLRDDARWSNGEAVTANDFVDSWQRTVRIGDLAPHTHLLNNIEGADTVSASTAPSPPLNRTNVRRTQRPALPDHSTPRFGAEAVSARVLRVNLQLPDWNFPALVAHPVFRPVKLKTNDYLKQISSLDLVSNGAFHLAETEPSRVLLKRADHYWDKDAVNLNQVEFVAAKNAESALNAYRAGEVDAVTNSAFEPLALKLLAPYKDFRRETYGALTYYSVNTSLEPFDDVRVREALAIAIDRDRLTQDEMGGATEPAKRFLPEAMSGSRVVVAKDELLEKDHGRARRLLAEAGFPEGDGFPKIRLLINRNEQQRMLAQSVAQMWQTVLNIETEIIIKPWDEYEAAIRAGDYDVARRGLVMQTTDELTNIRMLFQQDADLSESAGPQSSATANESGQVGSDSSLATKPATPVSEAEALNELKAIPLYFASSYALVKPYVTGFETNVLDAPSLKRVQINTAWKHPTAER